MGCFFYTLIFFIIFFTDNHAMEPVALENSLLLLKKAQETNTRIRQLFFTRQTTQKEISWQGISLSAYNAKTNLFAYSKSGTDIPRVNVIKLPDCEKQFCKTLSADQHTITIQELAFSPQGDQLIIRISAVNLQQQKSADAIYLINSKDQTIKKLLQNASRLTFNKDGSRCAAICDITRANLTFKSAAVWKTDCMQNPIYTGIAIDDCNILLNSDGSLLFLITDKGMIKVININTKEVIYNLANQPALSQKRCSMLLDDTMLFVTDTPNTVKIWDLEQNQYHVTPALGHSLETIVEAPNKIAIGNDKVIDIWNSVGQTTTIQLKNPVTLLTLSTDGFLLACICGKAIQLWDVQSNKCLYELEQDSPVSALYFSHNNSQIYAVTPVAILHILLPNPPIFELENLHQKLIKKIYTALLAQNYVFFNDDSENTTFTSLPQSLQDLLTPHVTFYIPEQNCMCLMS